MNLCVQCAQSLKRQTVGSPCEPLRSVFLLHPFQLRTVELFDQRVVVLQTHWLLLHLEYTTRTLQNGKAAKKTLENKLGTSYSTNKSTTETNLKTLLGNCPKAIINAKKARVHHTEANTPLPANPSTEVDHLAAALNDSALPHYRFT